MDEKRLLMASSAMEKPQQQLPPPGPPPPPPPSLLPLKCPRCDSSNTKFCYYNNYSLSQPRHFCKACKRYWTRGGTLRNVPVGGGCRKNKRVKRPPPPPPVTTSSVRATDRQQLRPPSSANHTVNPIFQLSSVVDHLPAPTHHHLSSNGLGFSSPHFLHHDHMVSSGGGGGEVLPNNYSSDGIRCISASSGMIMASSSTNDTLPSMTSLLASTIQHQKFIATGAGDQSYMMNPGGGGWNLLGYQNHHQMEQLGLSSTDPTPNYYWGMSNVVTAGNNWHDPAPNTESSVPSLI